jgi:hypothetical protein
MVNIMKACGKMESKKVKGRILSHQIKLLKVFGVNPN